MKVICKVTILKVFRDRARPITKKWCIFLTVKDWKLYRNKKDDFD
ncbi:Hypothetical protein IALB_2725 [Ignavibacterium album JCM 16511]|uniref:Uncharacterized protein n=1 Tax=Ignavibacterium album (strain DSM 19864 / JCM 16511 / NBRC 101810 / Mat9-16) TaxID=945713 RepID=I0AN71_IGNAJ|nr:Hypothetical protein IALB_2725 [Ignavibacterium album JCM 16511]